MEWNFEIQSFFGTVKKVKKNVLVISEVKW